MSIKNIMPSEAIIPNDTGTPGEIADIVKITSRKAELVFEGCSDILTFTKNKDGFFVNKELKLSLYFITDPYTFPA